MKHGKIDAQCAATNHLSLNDLGMDSGGSSSSSLPSPPILWRDGTYSLSEIVQNVQLPVVVQCKLQSMRTNQNNFDISQPLLLYRRRSVNKVLARNLSPNSGTENETEIDHSILIPSDYKGWFAVCKDHNNTYRRAVPYTFVEKLARTKAEQFLIAGSERLKALQVISRESNSINFEQRILFPGDVVRKGRVYTGKAKVKQKGLIRKSTYIEDNFLMCTDELDREFMLSVSQKGRFYPVGPGLNPPVFLMKDLLAEVPRPCVVNLLYGRKPNTPCSFTGKLVLKEVFEDDTIISATILNMKNILLEIPVASPLKFTISKHSSNLTSHKGYQQALRLCAEKAEIYARDMKIIYPITHRFKRAMTFDYIQNDHTKLMGTESHRDKKPEEEEVYATMCRLSGPLDFASCKERPQQKIAESNYMTLPLYSLQEMRCLSRVNNAGTPLASPRNADENEPIYESIAGECYWSSGSNESGEYDGWSSLSSSFTASSTNSDETEYANLEDLKELSPFLEENCAECENPTENGYPSDECNESDEENNEDDLPLGASLSTYQPTAPLSMSNGSYSTDSGVQDVTDVKNSNTHTLKNMSVQDLSISLKDLGIRKEIIDKIAKEKIDGNLLMNLDKSSLESIQGIKLLDITKISMFVQGWRPSEI